uniref:Uncharacterized protein n=1 Tax=Pseudonaja textilis TaxID=8673 RepID=A0A670ZC61_PSETE
MTAASPRSPDPISDVWERTQIYDHRRVLGNQEIPFATGEQETPHRDGVIFLLEGGGRRAWQKSWFMSRNPFWRKVDFRLPPFSLAGAIDEPGPNRYNIDRAYTFVLHRSPSIIINPAPLTPGPGAYNVDKGYNARLPRCPSFYIQGVRRPKKHETGPFSTL